MGNKLGYYTEIDFGKYKGQIVAYILKTSERENLLDYIIWLRSCTTVTFTEAFEKNMKRNNLKTKHLTDDKLTTVQMLEQSLKDVKAQNKRLKEKLNQILTLVKQN